MKLFTNIFICLCIALSANAISTCTAFAQDTDNTIYIPGDTISSAPFDPDTTKEPDSEKLDTNQSSTN